ETGRLLRRGRQRRAAGVGRRCRDLRVSGRCMAAGLHPPQLAALLDLRGDVMNLITEAYLAQEARWPKSGRHILAQFDEESVVVYQAYNPSIGRWAARHGHFGGEFKM